MWVDSLIFIGSVLAAFGSAWFAIMTYHPLKYVAWFVAGTSLLAAGKSMLNLVNYVWGA